jgi:hypothetical protein
MTPNALPRVFIGSSVEALGLAYALHMNIELDAKPTVWTQAALGPAAHLLRERFAKWRAKFVETVCDSSLRGEIEPSERDLALGQEIRALCAHVPHFLAQRCARRRRMGIDHCAGMDSSP